MCYSDGTQILNPLRRIAVRGGLDESWGYDLGPRRKDMNRAMRGEFQKTLRLGQFGGQRVRLGVPFSTNNDYPRAILHFQTPDSAVWFGAKRVRHAQ
jgi:hypothetical protein